MSNSAMLYVASGNAPLCAWVLIGEGQLGSAMLNGVLGAGDENGNFYWSFPLAQPLKGSHLLLDATFSKLNPLSQSASLTLALYQLPPGMPDLPEHRINAMFYPRESLTFGAAALLAYSDIVRVQ